MSTKNPHRSHVYAREKLDRAAWELATGEGDIKTRLSNAYNAIRLLRPEELPPELYSEWQEIHTSMTNGKERYDLEVQNGKQVMVPVDRVVSTLRSIRLKKAHQIVIQIYRLHLDLTDYLHENG